LLNTYLAVSAAAESTAVVSTAAESTATFVESVVAAGAAGLEQAANAKAKAKNKITFFIFINLLKI